MKPSDKVLIWVMLTSAAITGAIYFWKPDMHWGVYLAAWILMGAAGYKPAMENAIQKKALDDPKGNS
ncbi:hypothetical protein [Pseudomonas japonica]|uniref:hypothetical protein n=1 Tax=Pseudomonas japonica TaxID=256466 RepID=UPI003A86A3E8